jgi:hypothetical protein
MATTIAPKTASASGDQLDAKPSTGRLARNSAAAPAKAMVAIRGEHHAIRRGATRNTTMPSRNACISPNRLKPPMARFHGPQNNSNARMQNSATRTTAPPRRHARRSSPLSFYDIHPIPPGIVPRAPHSDKQPASDSGGAASTKIASPEGDRLD